MKTHNFSIEFFPPKTEDGTQNCARPVPNWQSSIPSIFLTFVPAAPRNKAPGTVVEIRNEGFDAAPHLSCVGGSKESIRQILKPISRMTSVAWLPLRGDLPSGYGMGGEFRYANELVELSVLRRAIGSISKSRRILKCIHKHVHHKTI